MTQNPYAQENATYRQDPAIRDRFHYGLYMPVPTEEHKKKAILRPDDQPSFASVFPEGLVTLSEIRAFAEKIGFHEDLVDRILRIEKSLGRLSTGRDALITSDSYRGLLESTARPGRALLKLAKMHAVYNNKATVDEPVIDQLAEVAYAHRIVPTLRARESKTSNVQIVRDAVEGIQRAA